MESKMKLVDVLALEMKKWPFTGSRLGQACDGSLHAEPFIGGHTVEHYTLAKDYPSAVITRSQWQAAVDALKAGEQSEEWSGLGMPPVGTVCESKMPPQGLKLPGAEWIWRRVEVVRHNDGVRNAHRECLVFDLENTVPAWVDELRPIRTAEQIAEEAREKEIMAMVDARKPKDEDLRLIYDHCSVLHDAGYRVQHIHPARKGGSNERPAD